MACKMTVPGNLELNINKGNIHYFQSDAWNPAEGEDFLRQRLAGHVVKTVAIMGDSVTVETDLSDAELIKLLS